MNGWVIAALFVAMFGYIEKRVADVTPNQPSNEGCSFPNLIERIGDGERLNSTWPIYTILNQTGKAIVVRFDESNGKRHLVVAEAK